MNKLLSDELFTFTFCIRREEAAISAVPHIINKMQNQPKLYDPGRKAKMIRNPQELDDFIARSKQRLKAILKRLRWSENLVLKNFNTNSSTFANNLLPEEVAEAPFPESCAIRNTVVIDASQLQTLVGDPYARIPEKFSDLQVNFNREQKLQLYEHVVENTEKLSEPQIAVPVSDSHDPNKLTFAEILAQKNKEKKKRRKYRTSKPTHIEEVRSLVELQMQALEQFLKPKLDEEEHNKDRKRQRSPSISSKTDMRENNYINRRNRSRSRDRITSKRRKSQSRDRNYYKKESHFTSYKHRCDSREKNYRKRERSRSNSGDRSYSQRYSRSERSSSYERGHNGNDRGHNGKVKNSYDHKHRRRSRSHSYEREYDRKDRRNQEYSERRRDGYSSKYIKHKNSSSHNGQHAYNDTKHRKY